MLFANDVPCKELLVPLAKRCHALYKKHVFDCSNIAMLIALLIKRIYPDMTVTIWEAVEPRVCHSWVRVENDTQVRYYDYRTPKRVYTEAEFAAKIKYVQRTLSIEQALRSNEYTLNSFATPEWMK